MDLIESLRLYRLEHRLTQQELAKTLGVSFITINRWLNRRVKPSPLLEHQIRKLLHQSNTRPRKSWQATP
ncbi:MAG: helix-turn-helix domain-containing protein [Candidatus Omnitrophota bacterium]|nr:helix-turn-helix domain-containing protein [Candidatus Omnitrophota bacterium]